MSIHKILLLPVFFLLNVFIFFLKFLLLLGTTFSLFLCFLFSLGILLTLFAGEFFWDGVIFVFAAYIFSPYGLPVIGAYIIAAVEMFTEWLKSL